MTLSLDVFDHPSNAFCNLRRTGNQNLSVVPRWSHVTLSPGSQDGSALLDHGLGSAGSLVDVALRAATETDVVGHIHVNPSTQELSQSGPVQREQSFEDYEFLRRQSIGASGAAVSRETVNWHLDDRSFTKFAGMGDQQFVFKRSRLVEVGARTFFQREMRKVSIVAIERKHGLVEAFGKVAGEIALPCS